MINTEVLRKKIIDLAIQGYLTQQLPEDGDAEDLYTTIQEKKEKLIKEGKIKKEKQQLEIMEEEIPFIIPSSWKWCRLESIFNFIDYRGATPNKIARGVPFVTAKNVRQGYTDYSIKEYISEEDYTKRQSRGISHKGDLLFTTEAPMGYVAIADLERFSTGQRLITLQQYTDDPLLNNKYYMYCISASFFQKQLEEKCSGTTVKGIKADRLKLFLIPLPPIEEQCRIVNLLDSVVNQLAFIDELKQQYESDRDILKRKIIDAGICGKLTEQLPEDGNAEDLYTQIQEEKTKHIKEGKIKKEKTLPEISDDEIPFKIPDNWKWVRLSDISYAIKAGGDKPDDFQKDYDEDHQVPVVANGIDKDGVIGFTAKACGNENTITVAGRGTIGFTVYRDYDFMPVVRLIVVVPSSRINSRYLKYVLQQTDFKSTGSSIPQLTVPIISPYLIPLPPLSEQSRIVDKLETVLEDIERESV